MVKIVSWNVNSIRVRLPHLIELDKTVKPDIVMLQETKSTDENFPEDDGCEPMKGPRSEPQMMSMHEEHKKIEVGNPLN